MYFYLDDYMYIVIVVHYVFNIHIYFDSEKF